MTESAAIGSLQPLQARWVRALLEAPVPAEGRATCDTCAMCRSSAAPDASDAPTWFDETTKCCTYLPSVWNFLAGLALADESPEARAGRDTVRRRIAAGVAVSPMGLGRAPRYDLLYRASPDAFGHAQSMRCPHHLDDGRCGIWRYREATCATWFCKHEQGQVGRHFWMRLLHVLRHLEQVLARHVVFTLDPGPDALEALFPLPSPDHARVASLDIDERPDPKQLSRLWGRWLGREEAFYREAGALVQALDWPAVAALGGGELTALTSLLQMAHRDVVSPDLPEVLRSRSMQGQPLPGGAMLAMTYSGYDPLNLSPEVVALLGYFDGRSTRDAVAAAEGALDVSVDPALVQRLYAFGLLARD